MKANAYTWPHSSWSIGLDSMINRIEKLNNQESGYPPHNLIKYEEDSFAIEVAVAGFNEEDISVEQDGNVLTISSDEIKPDADIQFVHKGIATRKFKKQFTLGEYIEVVDVTLINGILSIQLEKNIPEEKKPKTFKINSEAQFLQE